MKEAKELIEKYKKGLCTPDELVRLEKWFHHLGETEVSTLHEEDLLLAKRNFERHVVRHLRQGYSFRRWRAVAAAAAVIVALGVSLYFYLPPKGSIQDHALSPAHQDVAPGTNSAIITLPTGQSLHLAEDDHGSIAQAAGLKISRGLDGELRYEIEDADELSQYQEGYSIVETPRGGQHEVRLPDGTKIWLNAASSIKFPTTFALRGERRVELTGEAYFEVAHDESRPFIVESDGQELTVLGTAFNINSYQEEGVTKTTLVEGSIQIRKSGAPGGKDKQIVLMPGEQAILTESGFRVRHASIQQAVGWKNGDFVFQQEALDQILHKVARWYDIEVVYEPDVDTAQTFSGQVSRAKHLSEVLMILEATGQVHFTINDKRVVASR